MSVADDERILEEWEARREAAMPPGERELRLAVAALELTAMAFDSWFEDHPDGCQCRYCGVARGIHSIRKDAATAAGVAGMVSGLLRNDVGSRLAMTGETFGECFRKLADEADALDALADAGDEADEPAVVEGGAL